MSPTLKNHRRLKLLFLFFSNIVFGQYSDNPSSFGLPTGRHPHINTITGDEDANQNLNSEIEYFSHQFKTTVKSVTAKRGFSCLGAPCNIKGFPLMYTKKYSGFWGGARLRLTNESRTDPYLYALDLNFKRSDTKQQEMALMFDIPRILFLPYQPRLKIELNALNTNEVRYFGVGPRGSFYEKNINSLDNTRYNLDQYQIEVLLSFRVAVIEGQTYSLFGGIHSTNTDTSKFTQRSTNELFLTKPQAFNGGISGAWTLGLISDSRDSEFIAREGWMIEGGISKGGVPVGNYNFTRFFMNDRRFFSYKKSTLAHRLTFDVLSGDVPFWEFKRVAGVQPIADIASSDILRAYYRGRFHESFKLVESLEWRYHLGKIWLFGLKPETIFVPAAFNFGRLGDATAWSASSGTYFAFSNAFLAQIFAGYSPTGWNLSLNFGANI